MDKISKMEVETRELVEIAHEPDVTDNDDDDDQLDVSAAVNRLVSESAGSFAGLRSSIQQLLTRLRDSQTVTASPDVASSAAPQRPQTATTTRVDCRIVRQTAQVRPNQHRHVSPAAAEDKENVGWPRPVAGQQEERPSPWWSSEESDVEEWEDDDEEDGSPRIRQPDGGSCLRRLVNVGMSVLSPPTDDAPFSSSGAGGTRRRLFQSHCSDGVARVPDAAGTAPDMSDHDDDDENLSLLSSASKRHKRTSPWSGRVRCGAGMPSPGVAGVESCVSRLAIATPAKSLYDDSVRCQVGTVRHSPNSKFRARDVLMGKGQLKLALYINSGLLTVFVRKAKKVKARKAAFCNSYVKVEMQPRTAGTCSCRTMPVKQSSCPVFNQKFSFELSPEDDSKRLFISVWHRDVAKRNSEFLGCMSFGIAHVISHRVDGWYRILTERVGKTKHFAVQAKNLTSIFKRVGGLAASSDTYRSTDAQQSSATESKSIVASSLIGRISGPLQHSGCRTTIATRPPPVPLLQIRRFPNRKTTPDAGAQPIRVRAQIEHCATWRMQRQPSTPVETQVT